jgi:hypothetical protein
MEPRNVTLASALCKRLCHVLLPAIAGSYVTTKTIGTLGQGTTRTRVALALPQAAATMAGRASTPVFVAVAGDKGLAVLEMAEALRPEAAETVRRLQAQNVKCFVLTGVFWMIRGGCSNTSIGVQMF